MKFENKGLWMKEAEDKLASYNKQEHPDYVQGDDEICTLKTEDDELSGELLDEVEAEEMEKEVEDDNIKSETFQVRKDDNVIKKGFALATAAKDYAEQLEKEDEKKGKKHEYTVHGESSQANEVAQPYIEQYKGYTISFKPDEKAVFIKDKDTEDYVEVVAKASNSTKENLVKAAKNVIDKGNIDFKKYVVYEQ